MAYLLASPLTCTVRATVSAETVTLGLSRVGSLLGPPGRIDGSRYKRERASVPCLKKLTFRAAVVFDDFLFLFSFTVQKGGTLAR